MSDLVARAKAWAEKHGDRLIAEAARVAREWEKELQTVTVKPGKHTVVINHNGMKIDDMKRAQDWTMLIFKPRPTRKSRSKKGR